MFISHSPRDIWLVATGSDYAELFYHFIIELTEVTR